MTRARVSVDIVRLIFFSLVSLNPYCIVAVVEEPFVWLNFKSLCVEISFCPTFLVVVICLIKITICLYTHETENW